MSQVLRQNPKFDPQFSGISRQREGGGGGKTFGRGALGWINPAGLCVCGRFYCAPEPVALIRKRPLTGR